MQATAALNVNTKASPSVADTTAKSAASSASSEQEGKFEQSLSKASKADGGDKTDVSAKSTKQQAKTEVASAETTSETSEKAQLSAKESAKTDESASDSLIDKLFSANDAADGEESKDTEAKQGEERATATAKGESKAASSETTSTDVDDNMQEASDLLKRLDESNAALQSKSGQSEKSTADKPSSPQQDSVDAKSKLTSDEETKLQTSTQTESDGNLTKAQKLAQAEASPSTQDAASNKQQVGKKPETDTFATHGDAQNSEVQNSTAAKMSDSPSTAQSPQTAADKSDSKLDTAQSLADEDSAQKLSLTETDEQSVSLGSSSNSGNVQAHGEAVEDTQHLAKSSEGNQSRVTKSDEDDATSDVYGQSANDEHIDWDDSTDSEAAAMQGATAAVTPNQTPATAAGASQVNSTASSAATSSTTVGATGQNTAASPQWSGAPQANAVSTNPASAKALAANPADHAIPEAGSKHKAALAATGMQAMRNQKNDPTQPEPNAQVESLTAQQSQTTLSGLQRLEQAQQAQAPVQIKSELASEQLSERVQMMMSKNLKNIDIRLDPPELGRMQIRMNMNGDQANVQITVSNPAARDLIEQTLPRLREMLAQNGVALAEASVQQQSSRGGQAQQGSDGQFAGSGSGHLEGGADDEPAIQVSTPSPEQGISFFA